MRILTLTDDQTWDVVQGLRVAAANSEHYAVLGAKRSARKAGRPYTANDERETRAGCEDAGRFRAVADVVHRAPCVEEDEPKPITWGDVNDSLESRGLPIEMLDNLDASQREALSACLRENRIRFYTVE